jgi:hypothetical protein
MHISMKNPAASRRGIFVGKEIYYTCGGHTQLPFYEIHAKHWNFKRGKPRGMDPRLPIKICRTNGYLRLENACSTRKWPPQGESKKTGYCRMTHKNRKKRGER